MKTYFSFFNIVDTGKKILLCCLLTLIIGTGCLSRGEDTICNVTSSRKSSLVPATSNKVPDEISKRIIKTVYIHKGYAYISTNNLFEIIDITDPRSPKHVSQILFSANEIAIIGDYAFLNGEKLHVFDLSDPESPLEIFCEDNPNFQFSNAKISGDYAFTTNPLTGFQVFDISQLPSLVKINSYQSKTAPQIYLTPRPFIEKSQNRIVMDVEIHDNYAYVGENLFGIDSYFDGLIRIIDISSPENFEVLNTLEVNVGIQNLLISQDLLFVSASYFDSPAALIFDISDPTNPIQVKTAPLPAGLIAVYKHFAFFSNSDGLQVWDLEDPGNPVKSVWNDLHYIDILDIEIFGDHAFLATQFGSFRIVDITDPHNPVIVSTMFGS